RPSQLAAEFSVNSDQWITAAIFAVVIAHESVFGPDLAVAASSIAVNKDGTDRSGVWIANWQSFETVASHQFVAGFSGVGGFWIRANHARGKQSMFHIMPAGGLRMGVRAFFRERRGARQFWVEARIDFRERMNDRLAPIMVNDLHRTDATRAVVINKLLGRFLESFSVKDRAAERV